MTKQSEGYRAEVADSDWICQIFGLADGADWDYEYERRYFSTTYRKVGGSGLGEGRVMNMPPAPCANADIPMGFGIDGVQASDGIADEGGMGVFYSEMLDDNLDVIHIKPGLPRFSSLTRFYMNAMQWDAIKSVDYGWFDTVVSAIAGAVGYLFLIPFKIVGSVWGMLKSLASNDDTNRYSYYYLAPAYYSYWRTVDNMINDFAMRAGVIPGVAFNGTFDDDSDANKELTAEDISYFTKHVPGIVRKGTFGVPRIDVMAICLRHSLLVHRRQDYIAKLRNKMAGSELTEEYIARWEKVMMTHNPWGNDDSVRSEAGVQAVGNAMLGSNAAMRAQYNRIVHADMGEVLSTVATNKMETIHKDDGSFTTGFKAVDALLGASPESAATIGRVAPEMDDEGFKKQLKEVISAGGEWVSFAVDEITETKVSISNSSGPSGLADMINGAVRASRNIQFNMAGGNIGDGVTATMFEQAVTTGTAAFNSLTSNFVGGLPAAVMGGKAFIEVPDVYQDSTMEFDSLNYSITSTSTSGHPLAKLRMLLPYFCILGLAAPRSGGPASYCPPFLLEVQHKGRSIVQLGMIDSFNATFGEAGGWDINDIPNIVKMDFSIVNLSKGFHVPVDPDAALTYADTGAFCLHMSVLAGTALTDRDRSLMYNMKRKLMRVSHTLDRLMTPSTYAMALGSGIRSLPFATSVFNAVGLYNNVR